jgi:TonB family protein
LHTIHDDRRDGCPIGKYTSAPFMLPATSTLQKLRPRAAAADPLCEFESERESVLRFEPRPPIVLRAMTPTCSRRSARPKRQAPVLVIRFERPSVPWRQVALGLTTIVLLAVPSALFTPAATLDAAGQLTPASAHAADAPPRRIRPHTLSLSAVADARPSGSVLLVLDVTEAGDVARVAIERAVDLAPSFVEELTEATRSWRYEPARRDGIAVPAQVRVTVELHGDD